MRASGLGFASSVGRLGSIIMPWIVVYLNDLGTFLSYGIFGIIALIASFATLLIPFDTYLRELDKKVTENWIYMFNNNNIYNNQSLAISSSKTIPKSSS